MYTEEQNQQFISRLKVIVEKFLPTNYSSVIKLSAVNKNDLLPWLLSTTSLLPENATVTERMYCVLNNIQERPSCTNDDCEKQVKFHTFTLGYPGFCSCRCAGKSKQRVEKQKQTCLEKYGTTSYLGTKECIEKTKKLFKSVMV